MEYKAPHDNALAPSPEVSDGLLWVGMLAVIGACGIVLVQGVGTGWSVVRITIYVTLALLLAALLLSQRTHWRASSPLLDHAWVYLLVTGLVCFALQVLSSDPFVQPIIFTVPLVSAVLCLGPARATLVGLLYLVLIAAGLWLGGGRDLPPLAGSLGMYSFIMLTLGVFTSQAVRQAAARRQVAELAATLERERDYLAHLVSVTASLTRNLDLQTVLAQVAAAGRVLAHAQQAYVWLHNGDDAPVQLVAADPAVTHAMPDQANDGIKQTDVLALPLLFKDTKIGVLELYVHPSTAFTAEDGQRLQPFADAAAVAIENARLFEQAQRSATLAERNRLARELHDTIAQGLTAVTMQLEAAQRSYDRDAARARARLGRAHELARETLDDVRRSVWTLAEPLTEARNMQRTLRELAQRFQARTGVSTSYRHDGAPPPIDSAAATQVVRMVREALQNVEKHALANSITIVSEVTDDAMLVRVCDDGVGFALAVDKHVVGNGFGLTSLQERARLAGGTVIVQSAPGEGTCVLIRIALSTSIERTA